MKSVITIVLLSLAIFTSHAIRIGGAEIVTKDNEEAWDRIVGYKDMLHDDIYKKLEENDSIDQLCKYALEEALQQVVNGMNYWVKLSLCDDSYVDVYFYVPFGMDAKPQIMAIQFPKHETDELKVFRKDDISRKKNFYH
eukprot:986378_1